MKMKVKIATIKIKAPKKEKAPLVSKPTKSGGGKHKKKGRMLLEKPANTNSQVEDDKTILRGQIGSRPPGCERRCGSCDHCEAIQVPTTSQIKNAKNGLKNPTVGSITIQYARGDYSSNYKPGQYTMDGNVGHCIERHQKHNATLLLCFAYCPSMSGPEHECRCSCTNQMCNVLHFNRNWVAWEAHTVHISNHEMMGGTELTDAKSNNYCISVAESFTKKLLQNLGCLGFQLLNKFRVQHHIQDKSGNQSPAKSIGANSKQQGLIRLAKKNDERLGFFSLVVQFAEPRFLSLMR